MQKTLSFLFLALVLSQCTPAQQLQKNWGEGDFRIAFYNVENLFDTIDDPANDGDNEYLPTSKKKWTEERYQTKLEHLAKVVEGMGYPAVLGLAEVENANVLKDFSQKTSLKEHGYDYVHFESPDFRGIDVALMYKKSVFKVEDSKHLKINFPAGMIPDKPNYTTRDLLVVDGKLYGREEVRFIVAHLPSRSEGQKETEPRRLHVAAEIRKSVDEKLKEDNDAQIIVMGDMNDEPTDPSMAKSLGALQLGGKVGERELFNCFSKLHAEGKGSYRYKGDWNTLDQIILSSNLVDGGKGLNYQGATIFQADWMLYKDEKYGHSPSRTYGGDRYFGGYSDHLPVYVEVKIP